MPELNLTGTFYPSFAANSGLYSDPDRTCIQQTVERLLSVQTSAERPGMLLGKIQSGKTKTFLAAIAVAFDNGFDIAIILTKGTQALHRQTLERVRREFSPYIDKDQLQALDIMTVPAGLTGYELSQKLIFVAKKQTDNLGRLAKLFRETYPQLASKRLLIIDDEADYASIGFRNTKEEGIIINRTARQIDALRQILPGSAFLQVTATPYSLYLQPEDFVVNGVEFRPVRPAFTELVPVNAEYVGSDYYFDSSQEENTVASFIHHPITRDELEVLHHDDRRRFKLEDCLTNDAIVSLRRAICNFITGGCIRRLQDQHAGLPPKKFSFLVHTEAQRAAHAWQEQIVTRLNGTLTEAVHRQPERLRQLLTAAYNDLANSIRAMRHPLPSLEEVLREAFTALEQGWLMITKVNSERQVEELLDNQGQLRLRTPLNIFIGGQILDRGVTIANLIGFFYGRRPQIYQQDTVLQHSRMFGFRPIEDLTVTRFYTDPAIYAAMRRMHESDVALRQTVERNPDQAVVFIQKDARGQIVPCSPNKILISNTTTLKPFKRILPVGFQTDVKTRVLPVVREIDGILARAAGPQGFDDPFEIELPMALELLHKLEPTLVMETEMGYQFDWDACRAVLQHMSVNEAGSRNRNKVLCLVRQDRNISRFQPALGAPYFSDAPDTAQREGAIARRVAIDSPMFMMLRQNGLEEDGWRGTPFYWPVIMAQRNTRVSIFAHETTP
jgi:Z1 domain-containing protein